MILYFREELKFNPYSSTIKKNVLFDLLNNVFIFLQMLQRFKTT